MTESVFILLSILLIVILILFILVIREIIEIRSQAANLNYNQNVEIPLQYLLQQLRSPQSLILGHQPQFQPEHLLAPQTSSLLIQPPQPLMLGYQPQFQSEHSLASQMPSLPTQPERILNSEDQLDDITN